MVDLRSVRSHLRCETFLKVSDFRLRQGCSLLGITFRLLCFDQPIRHTAGCFAFSKALISLSREISLKVSNPIMQEINREIIMRSFG
ncbi:hypothetical protein SAMN06297251_1442 [Fulvimarina manganoxydans]|uniref:Uncharacterized protein n=1 Tax=Fulvimarina manganoxydans TaxID=937218 RepID=A0A1W2EZ03_9HYPH|nr:hypothetical protein SAMN06297251_1442 [Fulvimarina manganoxydans]